MKVERPFPERFEILQPLADAGMAELFLARSKDGTPVVLKRLPEIALDSPSQQRMFLQEAHLSLALSHPCLIRGLEWVEDEHGDFLVLEYVEGKDLAKIWSASRAQRWPLPHGFVVRVGKDLCAALDVCHRFRDPRARRITPILHRDVSLKNAMVTYDGRVKLLDLGLAKQEGRPGHTAVGMVKGTTGYMSPEQVVGGALDARTDIFSTGIVLFELLTGARLFQADSETDEMRRALFTELPRLDQLQSAAPPALVNVVVRALAPDRDQRFPSARALGNALVRASPVPPYQNEEIAQLMTALFPEERRRRRLAPRASPPTSEQPSRVRAAVRAPSRSRIQRFAPWLLGAVVLAGGGAFLWSASRAGPSSTATRRLSTSTPQDVPGEKERSPQASPHPVDSLPKGPNVREGVVTLISFPAAKVRRGSTVLGTTPLFKMTLPVGTHLLRLEGPDGRVRRLSVPVEEGREQIFKVGLDDLPTE